MKKPPKPTTEAYLHTIRGGYNDALRKKVRKIFSEDTKEVNEKDLDDTNFDLVVGILEEIRAVGINTFSLKHVKQIATIFELFNFFPLFNSSNDIDQYFATVLTKLKVPSDSDWYYLPDNLESLLKRYCTEDSHYAFGQRR